MANKNNNLERCTFCGKSRKLVETLIAGPPGIYICNECIGLCNTIISEQDYKKSMKQKI